MNQQDRYRVHINAAVLFVTLWLGNGLLEAATPIEANVVSDAVKGEVTSVILYSQQARIERTFAISPAEPGLRDVKVGPLPAGVVESSIQVEGTEGLSSVSVQLNRLAGDPVETSEEKEKQNQLEEAKQSLLRLQREDQALEKMRSRFSRILPPRLAEDDAPLDIDLVAWQGLLDMIRLGMESAATKRASLAPRLRAAEEKVRQAQNSLRNQLEEIERIHTHALIGLQDSTGEGGVIRLSYLISGAFWYPHYEVDVDPLTRRFRLRSFAIVQQQTGEDWPEVPIFFSTATPELGSDIPDLSAIRLARPRYQDLALRDVAGFVGGGREDRFGSRMRGRESGQSPGAEASAQLILPGKAFGREKFVQDYSEGLRLFWSQQDVWGFDSSILPSESNRGFLRTFSSLRPEQISSNGEPHRLLYSIKSLGFTEKRICTPELNTAVFRRITAVLDGEDPLLHGRASVFLGGDYLGQTTIKTTAPGEELTLNLGVDGQVRVQRVQREAEEEVGLFSKALHYRTDLEMVVENFRQEPISVLLRERIPFTEDDVLKVKVDRTLTSLIPEGLDSDDGLVSWQLDVLPGEPINLRFVWWIEAPPDVQLVRRNAPERLGKGE
ncbi:MAG: DUF4139 domain-containing protein [Planctomycetota bacterium]